ncbi:ferritin-like domain-containing protein [Sphaerosporella brunnea]|uniref:Ferritin-like domain-containing protein n=1 Tax=Sphaerosporella brunnea TaxID=1250544 RepID=A0A5J5F0M8_9PEZI|nr:ferritin-like domain-containing protein [Sphaerosporella brunnea]
MLLSLLFAGLFALSVHSMPQIAVSTTEVPTSATGTPGEIPSGNPPEEFNTYPNTGNLTQPLAMPYFPAGGNGTNVTDIPVYQAMSDFDWFSLALVLYQEWIELDLFDFGLNNFTTKDFDDAGLTDDDRSLIAFMADQEVGHAKMISNILGPNHPPRCTYQYPFTNVTEFVSFCQKLTRWGEAGVYGFLPHLDSRAAAQLLLQSITTEARQQMIFRQFEGLFPMPEFFQVGIPQSFAWTLLAPHIKSCPPGAPPLPWQNFPALTVTNNPSGIDPLYGPAITHNRTQLSCPGMEVQFLFEAPGKAVGPNDSYVTQSTAGDPLFAAWISQLNVTYTPLYNVSYGGGVAGNGRTPYRDAFDDLEDGQLGFQLAGGPPGLNGTAMARQPDATLYDVNNPLNNGTIFVALTDTDLYVTPYNISAILPHVRAGPAIYQAG